MYFTMHCLRCPSACPQSRFACPQSSFRFGSYQFPAGSWREWKYISLLPITDFLYFKFQIVFCSYILFVTISLNLRHGQRGQEEGQEEKSSSRPSRCNFSSTYSIRSNPGNLKGYSSQVLQGSPELKPRQPGGREKEEDWTWRFSRGQFCCSWWFLR